MRKVIVMLMVALLVCSVAGAEIYPMAFSVVGVDYEEDVLILLDGNGNEWMWEGAEDWMVGDVAAAIMEDKGTGCIYDDEIMTLRYCGYIRECLHNQFGTTGW